jgi:chromate transporter
MNPLGRLTLFLALMSSISFGGIPPVLPDIRHFVVVAHGWLSPEDFADFFALAQTIPGPNMILMMALVGWKVAGVAGALAAAGATAIPPCVMYFVSYRLWDRFRDAAWQNVVRTSLAPLTFGLVVAGGTVMAEAVDTGWTSIAITAAAAALLLLTRLNPLWMLGGAAALGALGVV